MVTLSSSNPVDTPTVQYLEWLFLDNHDAWGNMRAKRAFKPDYFAHAKLLGVDCGKLYGSKNRPLFLTTLFSSLKQYTFFYYLSPKCSFCLVKTKLSIFQKTKQLVLPWKMTPESCSAILSTHTCAEQLYAFFRCKPIIYKLWWLHFFSFQVQLLIVLVKLATSA